MLGVQTKRIAPFFWILENSGMFWLPTKVELMCPNMCFALYNIFGVENDMRSNYIPHLAPKIEFCSGKQKI